MNLSKSITISIAAIMVLCAIALWYVLSRDSEHGFTRLETNTPLGEVYYIHDPDEKEVMAHLLYPIGEADMNGKEGMAHYLEHLVASQALPKKAQDQNRDYNAFTTKTWTVYYMASDDMPEIFDYLASTMDDITLSQKFMEEERQIVAKEFQLRDSENPYFDLQQEFQTALYGDTGLARSVIGDWDDIQKFSPQRAIEIHRDQYRLEDAILLIRTEESKAKTRNALEKAFAKAPKHTKTNRPLLEQNIKTSGQDRKIIKSQNLSSQTSISGFMTFMPDYNDVELYILSFALDEMMRSTRTNLLQRKIVFDDKLFSGFDSYSSKLPGEMGSYFELVATIENQNAKYLSEYFYDWVKTIPEIESDIQSYWEYFVEDYLEGEEDFDAKGEYEAVLEGFVDYETNISDLPGFIETLQTLEYTDLINLINHYAENSHEISRIWQGESQ